MPSTDLLLLQIQSAFKKRIEEYLGRVNIGPVLTKTVKDVFQEILMELSGTREPEFVLTARQLRGMGYEVAADIPDRAVNRFKFEEPRQDHRKKDTIVLSLISVGKWFWAAEQAET